MSLSAGPLQGRSHTSHFSCHFFRIAAHLRLPGESVAGAGGLLTLE